MDNLNQKQQNDNYSWTSLTTPSENIDQVDVTQKPQANDTEIKHKSSLTPVLTLQLLICICTIMLLFISKYFLPNLFAYTMDWYTKNISSSVYFDGDLKNADFSNIFSATNDEI